MYGNYFPQEVIYEYVKKSRSDVRVSFDPFNPLHAKHDNADANIAPSWVMNPYVKTTMKIFDYLQMDAIDFTWADDYAPSYHAQPYQKYNFTRFLKTELDKGHIVLTGWMSSKGSDNQQYFSYIMLF